MSETDKTKLLDSNFVFFSLKSMLIPSLNLPEDLVGNDQAVPAYALYFEHLE